MNEISLIFMIYMISLNMIWFDELNVSKQPITASNNIKDTDIYKMLLTKRPDFDMINLSILIILNKLLHNKLLGPKDSCKPTSHKVYKDEKLKVDKCYKKKKKISPSSSSRCSLVQSPSSFTCFWDNDARSSRMRTSSLESNNILIL